MNKVLREQAKQESEPLHILLVEHSPVDVDLCLRELSKAGFAVAADVVQTQEEFAGRLDGNPYDLVLADYRLPQWTGMEALALMQQRGINIPFILVTGTLGEETAVECIKKGATDYVLKDRLARLPVAVRRAREERSLHEEHARAEEGLREANEKLASWVKELEQRTREITLVNQMGELLQTCVTAEEAYAVIRQSAQKLFPAGSGSLCVFNSSHNLVEAVAVWGEIRPGDQIFAPDECWALRRGHVHLVEDPRSGLICRHLRQPPPATSMCVPMMAQGEMTGLLHLQGRPDGRPEGGRERPAESQERLAVNVAEHVALALANLRLREALRNQSIRDPLTGLFNRRYMEESLERELHRATRKQRPLGMILLDLDHFKLVNDTYGHEAGDAVLREVGYFLQSRTRREDIACRYGGEEFLLILPEASLQVTTERAEQLRQDYKLLTVHRRGPSLGAATLSLGVAVFPEHGSTSGAVLRVADAALYSAKAEGRDRVVVGQSLEDRAHVALASEGRNL